MNLESHGPSTLRAYLDPAMATLVDFRAMGCSSFVGGGPFFCGFRGKQTGKELVLGVQP